MKEPGLLVVVSGPSGTGKGTVCQTLVQCFPSLRYSISATTRKLRTGEVEGTNYFFVSPEQFQAMVERDELLEWAVVYKHRYGTPRKAVQDALQAGYDVLLEIDVQGALQVKQRFPDGILVFIVPPSLAELERRIRERATDSDEAISLRLNAAAEEMKSIPHYDYVVVNDKVEAAVNNLKAILCAEKCKTFRNRNLL